MMYSDDSDECTPDGKKYGKPRDPPGQKSLYIPPGDTEWETYRLSTFQHYPRESPVNPHHLASSGFFYTGYKDRVKCFSCGMTVDRWLSTDDLTSSHWHYNDCDFINGRDDKNVPIGSFLRHYQSSQHRALSPNCPINIQAEINGEPPIFQSNISTQIMKVKTVNNQTSIAPSRVHEPNSENSATNITHTQISSSNPTPAHTNSIKTNNLVQHDPDPNPPYGTNQSDLVRLFPCLSPLYPHMRDVRRQTFIDHFSTWPAHQRHDVNEIMTSSSLISEARLLGFDDDVIRLAVARKYETDDKHFTSLHDLVEAILMMADDNEEDETSSTHNNIAASSTSTLHDQMQRMEESKRCRVCREDDACVVFIPCGHLCCCLGCGKKIKKCPICKEVIQKRVQTYIS